MKKIASFLLGISLLGGLHAQDTIPFLAPCFSHHIVTGPLAPFNELPLDTLRHCSSSLWPLAVYGPHVISLDYKHRIPFGSNIYGIAITAGENYILSHDVKSKIYTYDDNRGCIYYDSIVTNGDYYRKKCFMTTKPIILLPI